MALPKLYMFDASPPSRSVLLTAKALGITLDLIRLNLTKADHLTPEYLKMNPQHTVPTLDDNGIIIWDSHAINIYLVTKYGKDSFLYPEDPYKRAVINQRLHFDSGILFPAVLKVIMLFVRGQANSVPAEKAAEIQEAYEFLEKFLEDRQWMACDNVTLADFSLISSVTTADVLVPVDQSRFSKLNTWIKRAEGLPYYEANKHGLNIFRKRIEGLFSS
ncbi:hypothetical protein ILUMI_03445 [Ignelater luminosus]|uniref:Uncharacterized protein n=1 Tax=Ignelater luminosus TaxID=2038154 RepID=A0A8K0DGJ3_IGNLU|nr:hypothetical protein ILUMI_03445 [Ignelater luminosus]